MFPGKSNSLDALCRRLEVDNSNRTLHGALLDAGLLAEVYIRMTRGQDSLVIDVRDEAGGRIAVRAHRSVGIRTDRGRGQRGRAAGAWRVLADIDKASGGRTLWRGLGA